MRIVERIYVVCLNKFLNVGSKGVICLWWYFWWKDNVRKVVFLDFKLLYIWWEMNIVKNNVWWYNKCS